ncbi:MAG: tetratricopeptide repeat protein [Bacteroidetes bacterium]|nr:tetratricopeptide repeat protein [Bacteroidota bacterium]
MRIQSRFTIISMSLCCMLAISCSPGREIASGEGQGHKKEASIGDKRNNAALFAEAVAERLKGNDVKAKALFEQALEADENDHASMYELAELYAREGKPDQSFNMMRQAVELAPENQWYQIRLARVYRTMGKTDEYTDVFEKLVEKYPTNAEYISELSTGLLLQGKYEEAISIYNRLEKQIGINEMLSMQKQAVYLQLNQPEKATAEIERLAIANPYEPRYQAMLAETYIKQGNKDKALEAYNRIKKIDPDNGYVHVSLVEFYLQEGRFEDAFNELHAAVLSEDLDPGIKFQALLYWLTTKEGKGPVSEQSIGLINGFIGLHPDNPKGIQLLAEIYFQQDKIAESRDLFLRSIEIDSSNYKVWENLLLTDSQLNDTGAMVVHGNRALNLFPEQPLPYLVRGMGLSMKKDYEMALKSFETGRKFVVGNDLLMSEFFNFIGDAQNKLGNNKASDFAFEKALIINPENSLVLNNFAYYLSLRGEQLDKAVQMAAKAVSLDPENPSNIDTYAWVLYKLARYDEALVQIEKALKLSSKENGTLREHFGDILFKLNRQAEALENWKKAAKAGETSPLIQKKIETGILYE